MTTGERSIWDNKSSKYNLSRGDGSPGGKRPDYSSADMSFKITRANKSSSKNSTFKGSKSGAGGQVTNIKISRKVSPNDKVRNSNLISSLSKQHQAVFKSR